MILPPASAPLRCVRAWLSAALMGVAAAASAAQGGADPDPAVSETAGSEASLAVDALPQRYHLHCPDRRFGTQSVAGEWDEHLGATVRWRPARRPPLTVGLIATVASDRDDGLRALAGAVGLETGLQMLRPTASQPVRVVAVARYAIGLMAARGQADGVPLETGFATTTSLAAGIEASLASAHGGEIGIELGYGATLIGDGGAFDRIGIRRLSGYEHGPTAAVMIGWRW